MAAPPHQSPSRITTRIEVAVGLVVVLIATAPILVGDGVDVPDDFLIYDVAGWEWLRHAALGGDSIWLIPGKFGGASLFGDVVPMAPFYPTAWLVLLFPVAVALPAAWLIHAFGVFLSFRWFARCFGVTSATASIVGLASLAGPFGVMAILDGRTEALPTGLWLPLVLGALERLRSASADRQRIRWAALASLALAMLILGTHLRIAAVACVVIGLWCLIRPVPLRWAALAVALGVLGGAPGYWPMLQELGQTSSELDRWSALALPSASSHFAWVLYALLVPEGVGDRPAGLGTVLLAALLLGFTWDRKTVKRLTLIAAVLVAIPVAAFLPGIRVLTAPFLLVTHPLNGIYAEQALFPALAVAALGLDRLVAGGRDELVRRIRTPLGALLGAMLAMAGMRAALGGDLFVDSRAWVSAAAGFGQAVVVLGCMGWLLTRPWKDARVLRWLVLAVGALDLLGIAVRLHVTVPSEPVDLWQRTAIDEKAQLEGAVLNARELAELEGFAYEATYGVKKRSDETWGTWRPSASDEQDLAEEPWAVVADDVQTELLDRYWPVHITVAEGLDGVSGYAKLPPARAVAMLAPLATIARRIEDTPDVETTLAAEAFQTPDAVGSRTLALYGGGTLIMEDEPFLLKLPGGAPLCYSPTWTEVVAETPARVERLLDTPFAVAGPALLESPIDIPLLPAAVDCSGKGTIAVDAPSTALVVLRQRFHPGWQIRDGKGLLLDAFPVNQVHLGVLVAPGQQTLTYRFVPPGMIGSCGVAAVSWAVMLLLLAWVAISRRFGK